MRCKKYLKNFFLSCLVSEIQLFVYIFGWNSKWPPEVQKGSPVKFFEVSYYQNFFSPLQFIKVKIVGVWNCPMIFVFTFVTTYKSTNSWLRKKTIVWHQNDFGRQEIFSKFSSILLKYVLYLLKNIFRQFCIFELEIVTMSHGKYL